LVTLLLGASAPAAAIEVNLYSLANGVVVDSNTQDYDAWAANCPNVQSGSACDYADLETIRAADNTLFFWGAAGDAKNTTINLNWQGSSDSANITSVRVLALTEDDQSQATMMGPAQGAKDVSAFGGAVPFTFLHDPVVSPSPGTDSGATQAQGSRIMMAYGREAYSSTGQESLDAVLPNLTGAGLELAVKISVDGASSSDALAALADPYVTNPWTYGSGSPIPLSAAVSGYSVGNVNGTKSLAAGARDSLAAGEALTLELYNSELPTTKADDYPTVYMDDIVVLLNQSTSAGAQAGMDLRGLPDANTDGVPDDNVALDYGRTGNTLTATVSARAGTGDLSGLTYRVFNQGTSGTIGDGGTGSYGVASASGDGLTTVNVGAATDAASLEIGERSFSYTAQALGLSDTAGKTATLTQSITGGTNGTDTQQIVLQTVGPILGVSADDGANYLPYNSTAAGDKIDLGSVDISTDTPAQESLIIRNLFGTNQDLLTSLTLDNVGIDNDPNNYFCILTSQTGDCATDTQIADQFEKVLLAGDSHVTTDGTTAGDTGSTLPDMWIRFDPTRNVTDYTAILFFETDMNTAFGGNSGRLEFTLTGSGFGYVPTPAPGVLALLGIGLVGLAGARIRGGSRSDCAAQR
jgi:hypothetical protein